MSLDISLTGALVACDLPLPVGARGRLVAAAPGGRLATDFYVSRRRVEPVASGGTFGAAFVNLDDQNQKMSRAVSETGKRMTYHAKDESR